MDLTAVKQITTVKDETVVNRLLKEDWVILETTQSGGEISYHLGLVPGINKMHLDQKESSC